MGRESEATNVPIHHQGTSALRDQCPTPLGDEGAKRPMSPPTTRAETPVATRLRSSQCCGHAPRPRKLPSLDKTTIRIIRMQSHFCGAKCGTDSVGARLLFLRSSVFPLAANNQSKNARKDRGKKTKDK